MKKILRFLFPLLLIVAVSSCARKTDIESLQRQIDDLRNTQIASINSQISSIMSSLSTVQETQIKLTGYIGDLNIALTALQSKETGDIESLKSSIAVLEQKDTELKALIDNLKTYVGTEIKGAKDWASATFITLEQYATLQGELSSLKQDLSSVQLRISSLDAKLAEEIQKARTDLTAAIAASELSMKSWVNEKLTGYYTIAETEAKLAALKAESNEDDEKLQKEIDDLESALAAAKTELAQAYQEAISSAIQTNNGVIDGKIATAISQVQSAINETIAGIESRLSDLESKITVVEGQISDIIAAVQSVVVVPDNHDGSVCMVDSTENEIRFEVYPLSAAEKIVNIGVDAFSLDYVETKATIFSHISITDVSYNGEVIIVTADGSGFSDDIKTGVRKINARLRISDGTVTRSSEYFAIRYGTAHPNPDPSTDIITGDCIETDFMEATVCGWCNRNQEVQAGTSVIYGIEYSRTDLTTEANHIMASGKDGNNMFTCRITDLYFNESYYYRAYIYYNNTYEYGEIKTFVTKDIPREEVVDLGLSVNWRGWNLGASKLEEYGDYYAWGATEPWYEDGYAHEDPQTHWKSGKSGGYTWANCPFNGGSSSYDESYWNSHKSECVDANNFLLPANDAAHVNLGSNWRMPTSEEFDELLNYSNCSWTRTTLNGIYGYKVQSKKSGYTDKWIFLPAAGIGGGDGFGGAGSYGYYWSSCADTHHSDSGGMILFYSGGLSRNSDFRCYGLSVRPVWGDATLVSSVSLDKTELILHEGESNNLTGTVYPETAVNKSISWESSNADVATVDSNGNVTGISKGSAIITVTTADCSKTATCSVTVINTLPDGAVDLGLSVYWASCNLGASSPEDSGGYYQWAGTNDVTDTSIYLDWSNCPYHTGSDKNTGWTKYIPSDKSSYWSGSGSPDNKTVLDPEDDVAHVKLGGRWRMPTKEEWHELKAYCSWTEISLNGIYGFKIQSMKTGFTDNWIFLPAAGCRSSGSLKAAGSSGSYWYPSLSLGSPDDAYYLYFSPNGVFMLNGSYRYLGLSVRPVSE